MSEEFEVGSYGSESDEPDPQAVLTETLAGAGHWNGEEFVAGLPDGHRIEHHRCAGVDGPVIAMAGVVIGPEHLGDSWSPATNEQAALYEYYEGSHSIAEKIPGTEKIVGTEKIPGTELFVRDFVAAEDATGAALFSVEAIVQAAEAGAPVKPNLVYFPRSNLVFHPGAVPEETTLPKLNPHSPTGSGVVLTLDTGDVPVADKKNPQAGAFVPPGNYDPYGQMADEVVRGHGPAIADFIGARVGAENSLLRTIDYSKNATGALMVVPLNDGTGHFVRCFDELALLASLQKVEAEILEREVRVLNLSLGTLSCPAIMGENDLIYRFLQRIPHVSVVVAAGNHGKEAPNAPSYPAVYGMMNLPGQSYAALPNVISVGASTDDTSKTLVDNSARAAVVEVFAPGQDVVLDHPDHGVAEWTGTSFAAPYISVAVASGTTIADLKKRVSPFYP